MYTDARCFRSFRQGSDIVGALQSARCPRNYKFDLKLSKCVQCQPCTYGQFLHPFSCQCKCLNRVTCSSGQAFDMNSCRCVSCANVCNTVCPGKTVLDPITCACSCPQSAPSSQRCNSRQSLRQDTCECVCDSVLPAPKRTKPTTRGEKALKSPARSKTRPKTRKTKAVTPKKRPTAKTSNVAKGPIHGIAAAPKAPIPNKHRREHAGEFWRRKPRRITRMNTRVSKKTHSGSRSSTSATRATGRPVPLGGGVCPVGQLLNMAKCQCQYA